MAADSVKKCPCAERTWGSLGTFRNFLKIDTPMKCTRRAKNSMNLIFTVIEPERNPCANGLFSLTQDSGDDEAPISAVDNRLHSASFMCLRADSPHLRSSDPNRL